MAIPDIKPIAANIINTTGNVLLSPPRRGFGFFRNHGPRTVRKVALTFDDGPNKPCTEALLDAMGELNVKGTFFCVGTNVQLHPDLITRAYSEGHIIGNHSAFHTRKANFILHDDGHFSASEETIRQVIGRRTRLYRPPWGWLTPWEGRRLTQARYTIIGWDVYTLDWQLPEPDGHWMAEDARSKTRPGSIYCFHDGTPHRAFFDKKQTIRAVKRLVPAMRDEGYEFVTIAELLGVPAYQV